MKNKTVNKWPKVENSNAKNKLQETQMKKGKDMSINKQSTVSKSKATVTHGRKS